jgi:hypothetical protein
VIVRSSLKPRKNSRIDLLLVIIHNLKYYISIKLDDKKIFENLMDESVLYFELPFHFIYNPKHPR